MPALMYYDLSLFPKALLQLGVESLEDLAMVETEVIPNLSHTKLIPTQIRQLILNTIDSKG